MGVFFQIQSYNLFQKIRKMRKKFMAESFFLFKCSINFFLIFPYFGPLVEIFAYMYIFSKKYSQILTTFSILPPKDLMVRFNL